MASKPFPTLDILISNPTTCPHGYDLNKWRIFFFFLGENNKWRIV